MCVGVTACPKIEDASPIGIPILFCIFLMKILFQILVKMHHFLFSNGCGQIKGLKSRGSFINKRMTRGDFAVPKFSV